MSNGSKSNDDANLQYCRDPLGDNLAWLGYSDEFEEGLWQNYDDQVLYDKTVEVYKIMTFIYIAMFI